ncbi:carboxymuconolactone decarboxylase family protein [Nocardia sp. GCM10030253]|uniref:carboxymuconolactone decarboxylase family protein n=1 Tax=Nocardia sp. GCM10030253 TaxID=3273404 RepID=UPI00362A40E8
MPQIPLIEPESTTGTTQRLFAEAQQRFGITPNIAKAMANSPAAMRGYLDFAAALFAGGMPPATRTRIGVLVSQENRSDYGLSSHSFVGTRLHGLSRDELDRARSGTAEDPKDAAVLGFAAALVRRRGAVTDAELEQATAALSNAEIVDIVGYVALAIFDNYLTLAGRVANDWPLVSHTDRTELPGIDSSKGTQP